MRTKPLNRLFVVCGATLLISWLFWEVDSIAEPDSADSRAHGNLRLGYARQVDYDYILTLEQMQYVGRRLDADWDSPSNALSKNLEAHLRGRMGSSSDRLDNRAVTLSFEVTGFTHRTMRSGVQLETLGVDHVVGSSLELSLLPQGPFSLVQVAAKGDALAFSGSQSYLQSIRQWLQLSFLVLPETALQVGDTWRKQRQTPVDIPGLPDMTMEVDSWYLVLGIEPCGQQQCARIGEVYWAWASTLRSLEMLIQLNLWAVGQAQHRFAFDPGKPYQMQGRAVMDIELTQYQADGSAVYGTESTFTSVYQLRVPKARAAVSWKQLRHYDPD